MPYHTPAKKKKKMSNPSYQRAQASHIRRKRSASNVGGASVGGGT